MFIEKITAHRNTLVQIAQFVFNVSNTFNWLFSIFNYFSWSPYWPWLLFLLTKSLCFLSENISLLILKAFFDNCWWTLKFIFDSLCYLIKGIMIFFKALIIKSFHFFEMLVQIVFLFIKMLIKKMIAAYHLFNEINSLHIC